MIFIYYKVFLFTKHISQQPQGQNDNATMLLFCSCRVTVLLLCSLFFTSRARLFLIYCTNFWKKKDSILFYHFFLCKAQYSSFKYSDFGNISLHCNDHSHRKIMLTFFFVWFYHCHGRRNYKAHSLFIVSRASS